MLVSEIHSDLLMSYTDCVVANPVSLQVVFNLVAHDGILGCMGCEPAEYLDSLQNTLTLVLGAMHESAHLEHTLLAAACLVKALANGWKPDFDCKDDPYSGEKLVAWCLAKIYDAQVGAAAGCRLLLKGICISVRSSSIHCCQHRCLQVSLSVQQRP